MERPLPSTSSEDNVDTREPAPLTRESFAVPELIAGDVSATAGTGSARFEPAGAGERLLEPRPFGVTDDQIRRYC